MSRLGRELLLLTGRVVGIVILLAGCGGSEPAPPASPTETGVAAPAVQDSATQPAATVTALTAATLPAAETALPTPAITPTTGPTEGEAAVAPVPPTPSPPPLEPTLAEFAVPAGSHPHDVAPAPDGSVWYTAQALGELGRLDPASGETRHIDLGQGSAPHGVIVGPDGAPWLTDGGLNAIVRVDPATEEVQTFPLPEGGGYANLTEVTA